jgi:hypothetical protein
MPPPTKKKAQSLPKWALGLLAILGIVLCLGMALVIRIAPQWTATVRGRDVAIWLMTPHLAPGDIAQLDVDVYGGKRAALRSIQVSGEGVEVRRALKGATWGGVIMSRRGDSGHATEQIELRVPASAEPGQAIDLTFRVEYTLAVSGRGGFTNEREIEAVRLRLAIKSPVDRTLARLWSAAFPLGLLGVAVTLFWWKWHWFASLMTRKETTAEESSLSASLGTLFIAGMILWAFAGWVIFALPIVAATGFTSDWFQLAMGAVWIFAPPLLGRKLAGKAPPPPMLGSLRALDIEQERPYREPPPAPKKPPSLKQMAAALREGMGLRVTIEPDGIGVRRSWRARPLGIYVRNPKDVKRVMPDDIAIEAEDARLAIEVILTLVPLLGPVELELGGASIGIDGTRDADALEKEWAARLAEIVRARIDAMRREILERAAGR